MSTTHKTSKQLQKHLRKEHKISTVSTYLREIVYGGNDGIITTFAVVAGFTGAQAGVAVSPIPFVAVLLFGLANLFADGVSMGLGNFLSTRAHHDIYHNERKKELHEIRHSPEMERQETVDILISHGFTLEQAKKLTHIYSQNPHYWANFMMAYELKMQSPVGENPLLNALATFFAFLFFGSIPLAPYVITRNPASSFMFSSAFTFIALLLLGVLRWRVTKVSIKRSIGETLVLGTTAAIVAYIVGTFFAMQPN